MTAAATTVMIMTPITATIITTVTSTNVLVNVGRAQTLGMETFVVWLPLTNLTLRGAYTWLADAQDEVANQRLLRRPEHSGSASVEYRFLRRFTATGSVTLVGPRPVSTS